MTSRTSSMELNQLNLSGVAISAMSFYGRLCAFGLFIGAVVTLLFGILILVNNHPCSQFVTATVAQSCGLSSCCVQDPPKSGNYTCTLKLNYTVDGKAYENVPLLVHSSQLYQAGGKVDICYSATDPTQITLRAPDGNTVGIILTVFGVIGIIGLGVLNYRVWKNKETAAIFGGFEAISKLVH